MHNPQKLIYLHLFIVLFYIRKITLEMTLYTESEIQREKYASVNKHLSLSSVTTVLDKMQNEMLIREIRLAEKNTK